MKRSLVVLTVLLGLVYGCQQDVDPKPAAYLALEFPSHHYKTVKSNCPYTFKINEIAKVKASKYTRPCMWDIEYPNLKGTIYLTYEKVDDNLKKLLEDAQNLPLKHTIKADQIIGDKYENPKHHTYGMLYTITGNAASQAQFYLTDSTDHFMTGSIYFRLEPNYDSVYPAAEYIKSDMKKLMETLKWED